MTRLCRRDEWVRKIVSLLGRMRIQLNLWCEFSETSHDGHTAMFSGMRTVRSEVDKWILLQYDFCQRNTVKLKKSKCLDSLGR